MRDSYSWPWPQFDRHPFSCRNLSLGTGNFLPVVARSPLLDVGRVRQLCPGRSDVDLFSYGQSIVDFDAQVSDRALNLRMTEEQLHGAQIARSFVDQRGLGPAQ